MLYKIQSALFGLAVGDALGVPVEFQQRDSLKQRPVTGMRCHGTWNQPAGTWSDDSSLAFCLAESLTKGYSLNDIAQNFVQWKNTGFWGAHHRVFDVGNATHAAIRRFENGCEPQLAGGQGVGDNGNGSLMRILPLLFHIHKLPVQDRFEKIKAVSSITHAHFRSVLGCFIYLEMALALLHEHDAPVAYERMRQSVNGFIATAGFNADELALFNRILKANIGQLPEENIFSGGYVLHTLEASLWCLLHTDNYADAVLKAVNLGGDTDTTGCVTGGLAGLLHGYDDIYSVWLEQLARKDDIDDLCRRLATVAGEK